MNDKAEEITHLKCLCNNVHSIRFIERGNELCVDVMCVKCKSGRIQPVPRYLLDNLLKRQREICAEVAECKEMQQHVFGPKHILANKNSILAAKNPLDETT